jgi:hypothetical protein
MYGTGSRAPNLQTGDLIRDPAGRRAEDRITFSDWRWSAPGAQVSAVMIGCSIAV